MNNISLNEVVSKELKLPVTENKDKRKTTILTILNSLSENNFNVADAEAILDYCKTVVKQSKVSKFTD